MFCLVKRVFHIYTRICVCRIWKVGHKYMQIKFAGHCMELHPFYSLTHPRCLVKTFEMKKISRNVT